MGYTLLHLEFLTTRRSNRTDDFWIVCPARHQLIHTGEMFSVTDFIRYKENPDGLAYFSNCMQQSNEM